MKVKNLYVLIARDVSVDAGDQMTSIMKIIDKFGFGYNPDHMKAQGVTLGDKPVAFSAKYIVTTAWHFGELLKKDTFISFRLNIFGPKSEDFGGPTQEHLVPTGIDKINMNFNMEGIPVTESGRYKLAVQMLSKDGKLLAEGEYPFQVEVIQDTNGDRLKQIMNKS